ncbi:exported hypothetical protein [Desulfamplus magnetovallimortis]|uniref:Uncharacterized protein n=1 Tax=Desulfamplus magnetovallimortis TaxID=1246637 RepID=A0A1W1HA61_9BACT|nr:hypothetical protein [Desulfamplus magnetovallimortis]SLM29371.1 exported hypothetical protein [Desulfamplus magnetovallimortis]
MKFGVMIKLTMWICVCLIVYVMLPATLLAVDIAPRISDREITEKLARLEAGQDAVY